MNSAVIWFVTPCGLIFHLTALCHGSGSWSLAYHSGVPSSILDQSMWDLWWTKWRWDRFFSKYFRFPLSVSFRQCSKLTIE